MPESAESNPAFRRTTFHCVTGHTIPPALLDQETEIATLDAGAVVRVCRRHGAPIAIDVSPPENAQSAATTYLEGQGGP